MTTSQKSCECCMAGGTDRGFGKQFFRRFLALTEWAIPGAIFVMLPKCPLCLVAYIAVGTGIGISVSTAVYLRMSLVAIGVMSILFLVVRLFHRLSKPS